VGLSILWQAGAGRHSAGRASRGAPDPLQEREGQRYGRARTANGNEHEGEPEPKTSRLYLVPFGEITLGTERRDLVKGIIPRVGLTVAWGPPKEGKSFTVFDMVMHIALGWPYRGRRVHQGPVVYCAFEGQSGIKARVEAWRQRHLAETTEAVPFYLEPVTINLIREHQDLIAVIKRQLGEAAPVAVVLDTLNRSLHGSESSDEDMSAYVRASDAIREAFQCAVIVVHHCGHGADRPRGHSALIGAADAVIAIRKVKDATGEVVVLEVEMVKDGEAGAVVASRLKGVTVGIDEDGEAITSCVVEPAEFNAGSRPPKVPTLSNIEQIALKALQYAIGEAGVPCQARTTCLKAPMRRSSRSSSGGPTRASEVFPTAKTRKPKHKPFGARRRAFSPSSGLRAGRSGFGLSTARLQKLQRLQTPQMKLLKPAAPRPPIKASKASPPLKG